MRQVQFPDTVEEENHQLRDVQRAQEEQIVQDRERIWDLERSCGMLRTLINSLVETVGLIQNDVARIHHQFVNNRVSGNWTCRTYVFL